MGERKAVIQHGDSRTILRDRGASLFDACVTDPPYALGTLNDAGWDTQVAFDRAFWAEVLRTLKPGAWILSFGGARTYHRMVTALEDAGAEVHDQLVWVYSSGFPRGKDPSAAIAKAGGDPAAWEGYGTTLKPSVEPIVLARKPREGTVAQNVVAHGTGLLDIGGNRIGAETRFNPPASNKAGSGGAYMAGKYGMPEDAVGKTVVGRHPANVIIDDLVAEMDPELSRYFFVAKPTKREREEASYHKTLKPLELMRHLVRLVTPPGGHVLDPFSGSGTTGVACLAEEFRYFGIEQDAQIAHDSLRRLQDHGAAGCWDCNDTGDLIDYQYHGGLEEYGPEPIDGGPCWCPKGEESLRARGYTPAVEETA